MSGTELRSLIRDSSPVVAPSIFDGMSALLVREFGFPAAYIGSYATGATRYGLPDIGYIGLQDMADQVRRLAPVAGVPVIVDGEGGWGNPLHVAHAVRTLERAGAAAVHIEDHLFGKHLGDPTVIPTVEAVDKLKAALDARDSEDFLIIARTDAVAAEGVDAAIDRALAYQDAGADALFVSTIALEDALAPRLRAEARVPLVVVSSPGRSIDDHAQAGADVVLYFALTHFAATWGMRTALDTLQRTGSTDGIEADSGQFTAFDEFLGIDRARHDARRYGLIP